ncbi:MAG: tRNA (adenosine(37)-N6)-threonylcarbamoyltransferase complex ATPase subunit type 1 TsaE [Puniceicoccales bacterium]|jgi:tRNA threonylcarbamoyladenosine biosynthesis protein TsaE|nr:tRNA (adenosine(37)-N6)-threonylcarbamoyltransferase complex ATPase subunit type 1 TsaE [Puniceicoccales bacterium]
MSQLFDVEIICKTEKDTRNLAMDFAKLLPHNSSIALVGDLGTGKTTFVGGLARGLGIADTVRSPSFNILNIYSSNVPLLHIDAYRLDGSEQAMEALMLNDLLVPPYYLAVEWPERLYNFLETCTFKVIFSMNGDFSRTIRIRKIRQPSRSIFSQGTNFERP